MAASRCARLDGAGAPWPQQGAYMPACRRDVAARVVSAALGGWHARTGLQHVSVLQGPQLCVCVTITSPATWYALQRGGNDICPVLQLQVVGVAGWCGAMHLVQCLHEDAPLHGSC